MTEHIGARGRAGRDVWAKRVASWAESGLSAVKFASSEGINHRSLTYWKWRLGKEARSAGTRGAEARQPMVRAGQRGGESRSLGNFIEVLSTPRAERIEVELGNGRRLLLPHDVDGEALRRVLAVLEAP